MHMHMHMHMYMCMCMDRALTVGRQKTRLRGPGHTNPRYPTWPKEAVPPHTTAGSPPGTQGRSPEPMSSVRIRTKFGRAISFCTPCFLHALLGFACRRRAGREHLEVSRLDILRPRWVARIGVARSTEACFLTADRQCTELPLLRLPRLVPEVVWTPLGSF